MRNKIYITNEEEDISIELLLQSDSATGSEQLIVRSIKALLRSLSLQDYLKYGRRAKQRFDSDLNEIARTIHDVAAKAGWDAKTQKKRDPNDIGSRILYRVKALQPHSARPQAQLRNACGSAESLQRPRDPELSYCFEHHGIPAH